MHIAARNLELPGLDRPLRARLSATPDPARAVVLAHGFKGFMDWGGWPWVAARLAEAGVACLRFNFSHNGIGADPEAFTEPDLFEANTFGREVAELRAALEAARGLPELRGLEIVPMGHSRGGAIALLASEGARRVVTWASLAGLEGLHGFAGEREAWLRQGYVEVRNARTGQVMRLGRALLEDYEAHREALDVEAALRRLKAAGGRATAVHGDLDPAVPLDHGRRLEAAGARLVVIPGGDHTFGAAHPFPGEAPEPLKAALAATLEALQS